MFSCFSLLPQYLSKKLGADAAVYGQIQTVFAVAQLLGGVLYGRLGDLFRQVHFD